MRPRILSLSLLAIVPLAAAEPDLLAVYGQFRKANIDPNRVATAENLVLKKDGGTFQFNNGTLYALEPVLDQVAGVVFVGDGVFSFEPSDPVERAHLARFANNPRLEEPFKEAVLFFADSTFADLSAGAKFRPGTADPKAAGVLNDARKTFRDSLRTNVEARVLAGLTSPKQSVFLAAIHGQKHGNLLFAVDPMNGEAVSLVHHNLPHVYDVWSSYNPQGSPAAAQRALVHTARIDLTTEVDRKGKMEANAASEFTALTDGPRLLLVQLAPSLRVSKVAASDGSALPYIQEAKDKDADLWVLLPKSLERGAKYS